MAIIEGHIDSCEPDFSKEHHAH